MTCTWCSHLAALLGKNPGSSSFCHGPPHVVGLWAVSTSPLQSLPAKPTAGLLKSSHENLTERIRPQEGHFSSLIPIETQRSQPGLGLGWPRTSDQRRRILPGHLLRFFLGSVIPPGPGPNPEPCGKAYLEATTQTEQSSRQYYGGCCFACLMLFRPENKT